jgi:hypothetical protein
MANKLTDIPLIVQSVVDEIKKKDNLQEAGDLVVERVKTRTRLGKGVITSGGTATPLKALEPTTVEIRKSLKNQGKLTGPGATPAKSGINRTGSTLESLHAIASDSKVVIQLDVEGEKVAKRLLDLDRNGFTFMNLSKAELKAMADLLEEKARIAGQRQK